ncbi:MAG: hypothetical protein M3063_04460 [Actinomycetota bacterium]|nr:hypothetical protein [Actinomycetota bacterium]
MADPYGRRPPSHPPYGRPRHRRPSPNYGRRRLVAGGIALFVVVALVMIGSSVFGGGQRSPKVKTRLAGNPTSGQATTSHATKGPANGTQVTPQGVLSTWVQAENAKPGNASWAITKPANNHQIEGYADQVSIDVGGHVGLHVSTPAPTFTVQAFRMGYYGGTQARLVWTSPTVPAKHQPSCPVTSGTNMVQCSWADPVAVQTNPNDWPQGDYLFKLVSGDGYQSYVPLTIRDDTSHAAYLINNSVTTWQAYNAFGNYSLYGGPTAAGNNVLAGRAHIVSFDRPYDVTEGSGNGSGDFANQELRMVSLTEQAGLDVSYTTDVDLHANAQMVTHHRVFVSLGHDEYYSSAMRDGLGSARDAGVNVVFMGANAVYRHIRLQPSPLGANRQEIDYKDASLDPTSSSNPADSTPAAWRSPPNNNPESSLLGEMWRCNPVQADMVITDPGNWIFAGTGLTAGTHLAGAVGPEYDSYRSADPGPKNVEIVASSPVDCVGRSDHADMTYYTAASGAGVVDTGSIQFIGGVITNAAPGSREAQITQITKNILAAFGQGPAGHQHPSMPNGTQYPNG